MPIPRSHAWLVVLSMSTGCEALSGLKGDRELKIRSNAPALGGFGAGGDATWDESLGGEPTNSVQGGNSATIPDEHDSIAGEGGAAGAGGAGEAGAAGAASDEADDSNSTGIRLDSPSCSGLIPTGCEKVDPCLSLSVSGGSFAMGRDETGERADYFPGGSANERPEHPVTVSPFVLDKYEVTVARFRRFVESYRGVMLDEDAGASRHIPGTGWRSNWNSKMPVDAAALRAELGATESGTLVDTHTWTEQPGTSECRPINYLSWYVALAFCIWDGGRLPTEAEWEFAAAGGDEERLFPWGEASPTTRAVYNCSFSGGLSCTVGDLPRIGSVSPRGNGRFGHADLAGSLQEFIRDSYDSAFYAGFGGATPTGLDPVDIVTDAINNQTANRGGSYAILGDRLRSTARFVSFRDLRSTYTGMRCARDP